jgi:hypothetical protein
MAKLNPGGCALSINELDGTRELIDLRIIPNTQIPRRYSAFRADRGRLDQNETGTPDSPAA